MALLGDVARLVCLPLASLKLALNLRVMKRGRSCLMLLAEHSGSVGRRPSQLCLPVLVVLRLRRRVVLCRMILVSWCAVLAY